MHTQKNYSSAMTKKSKSYYKLKDMFMSTIEWEKTCNKHTLQRQVTMSRWSAPWSRTLSRPDDVIKAQSRNECLLMYYPSAYIIDITFHCLLAAFKKRFVLQLFC